ncbi:MAG: GSU2403 family nucleotidyltransferase fold protein [Burkholderiales bacterium]
MNFNDEQLRVIANLRQFYEVWIDADRAREGFDYQLTWKPRGGRDYLYTVVDRDGNGTSLGPRSPATESQFAAFQADKAAAVERERASSAALGDACRIYRVLRLGTIASAAAAVLREADRRKLLGSSLMVVGTNAMAAYEIEATRRFAIGMDATEDFDLAWSGSMVLAGVGSTAPILGLLKAVDATYTVNVERPFQARNKNAYEVEILLAPSVASSYPKLERLKPIALPEQEWLLLGTRVDQVVCGRDATPARIVAPDPRYFALQKLWLADKPTRDPLKRPKDRRQGEALLNAIATSMPHYRLDDAFRAALPVELAPHFDAWRRAATPA